MSQAWARLPVPAIGCRSATNWVVSSVVFIEFGRSSGKHSAENDPWNIVPQNSIADLNDVELYSTRTCPCSLEKICTDHVSPSNVSRPSQQAIYFVPSVSHKIGFRRTRLAPVGSRWCQGCSRVCPCSIGVPPVIIHFNFGFSLPGAAADASQKLKTLIAVTAACDSGL